MRRMVVDVSDHLLPVSVNSARASEGPLPLLNCHCNAIVFEPIRKI